MAAATRTVRITPEAHEKLQNLAKDSNRSLPEVLDRAISEYERQVFLEECSASYARLRENPEAWQIELQERTEWESTLQDGLEDEPPYPAEAMLTPEERATAQHHD